MSGASGRYYWGAERPAFKLWLLDDNGSLVDLSSGSYTHSFKIGTTGATAWLTKTTNLTGAAGAGVAPTGTPSMTVTWVADDLAPLASGAHLVGAFQWQLTSTISGLDRVWSGPFTLLDVVA